MKSRSPISASFLTILFASILLVVFLATTAFAARINQHQKGEYGRALLGKQNAKNILAYSFADESARPGGSSSGSNRVPLSTAIAGSQISPGVTFGTTWYDQQHSSCMGRMIGTGPHTGNTGSDAIVHMGWMYLESGNPGSACNYAYSAYKSDDATTVGPIILEGPGSRGGAVNVDVTPDNRAVVGGHYYDSTTIGSAGFGQYSAHIFFDGGPAYATFPNYARVPDNLAAYGQSNVSGTTWPKFLFQFGTDTVLHVVARANGSSMMYFRCVGFEGDGIWAYPPYVVDTVADLSHDIVGERTGDRVCLVWFAGLPYQQPTCDTCSGAAAGYDGLLISQMDNEVYYQESMDQGATFNPRVNITRMGIGEAGYKAFCDASALYDSEGNLHVIWHAVPWPADTCIADDGPGFCFTEDWNLKNARLLHWSNNVPFIRPIADQVYDVNHEVWDSCYAGAWNATISKPTISECDGKLYAIWVQFNDGKQGLINDCAEWAYKKDDPYGSANGDIWVSVSDDWGMTWDYQRNLTNSYTPHCDPQTGSDCASDHWPSMSRTGRPNLTGEDWSGAVIVDPSGGYTGDYYLDIQYVEDMEAGVCVQDEGTYTNNNMNWFRLPCVEPIPAPIFAVEWTYYGDPNYCKPGENAVTTLMIENIGNTELTLTTTADDGGMGWLGISGFPTSLPSGLAGMAVGTIELNQSLMTATGNYFGTITFEGSDYQNMPAVVEIELIIADTLIFPVRDTVSTGIISLVTSTTGNYGSDGDGRLNMDFYDYGDCDTMRGKIYLYDGSPLIGRILPGDDTTFNWSIWSADFFSEYGFRPQGGQIKSAYCSPIDAEIFQGGTFTTQDSAIGVRQIMVAPHNKTYVFEYLKIWSFDGAAHNDVMIGQAIDWDIPTDFKLEDTGQDMTATNYGAADGPRDLVYCQGVEAPWPDDTLNSSYDCHDNTQRFGGNAFIESYLNGSPRSTSPFSGFAGENDSLQAEDGFYHGKLYYEMAQSGLRGTDSVEDLHTVLTFEPGLDIGASDVYECVSVLATQLNGDLTSFQAVIDDSKAWYYANGGMTIFADVLDADGNPNPNGIIDVCDYCCFHRGNFFQTDADGNPLPADELLFNVQDVDDFLRWQFGDGRGPDCLDEVDANGDGIIASDDIQYLILYLYAGEGAPVPCP